MGLLRQGVPEEITLSLARRANVSVFVETGTFKGDTARWAAKHFKRVITIERAERLYRQHGPSLIAFRNVEPMLGDSRKILPSLLPTFGPAVFWLDAHWSSGETAGRNDECPLTKELATLSKRAGDIVLIDDARLFLQAPPPPHDPTEWPTILDIVHAFDAWTHPPHIQIIEDVIFAVPRELRDPLVHYSRQRQPQPSRVFRLLSKFR
jgi:hypothetical protein